MPRFASASIDATTTERDFLTADEVCKRFNLKRSRVYELGRLGLVPVVKHGRAVRFSRVGIEALHARAAEEAGVAVVARGMDDGGLLDRIAAAVKAAAREGVRDGIRELLLDRTSSAPSAAA